MNHESTWLLNLFPLAPSWPAQTWPLPHDCRGHCRGRPHREVKAGLVWEWNRRRQCWWKSGGQTQATFGECSKHNYGESCTSSPYFPPILPFSEILLIPAVQNNHNLNILLRSTKNSVYPQGRSKRSAHYNSGLPCRHGEHWCEQPMMDYPHRWKRPGSPMIWYIFAMWKPFGWCTCCE